MSEIKFSTNQQLMLFCWIGGFIFSSSLGFLFQIPEIIKDGLWLGVVIILPLIVWLNVKIFKHLVFYWIKFVKGGNKK